MYEKIQMLVNIILIISLFAATYTSYKEYKLKEKLIESNESLEQLLNRFFKLMER